MFFFFITLNTPIIKCNNENKKKKKIINKNIQIHIQKSTEPRKVKPILKTDEPICPEGKLSCGDGECLDKELFCNGKPDCKDESDENACCK